MENRRKQLRVFFACFLRSSSRAQRAAQQLAANYYGFAGFPSAVLLSFGPLSDALVTVISARFSWVPLLYWHWSFLGIVQKFYPIHILRIVLLMICSTMAAPRCVMLPTFACFPRYFRILSICIGNLEIGGVSLLSDSVSTLNQRCQFCQRCQRCQHCHLYRLCWAVLFIIIINVSGGKRTE